MMNKKIKAIAKQNYLYFVLFIFILGFYIASERSLHRNFYYIFAFLPVFILTIKNRLKPISENLTPWLLILTFLFYTALSASWAQDLNLSDLYDMIRYLLLVPSFLLLISYIFKDNNADMNDFLCALVICVGIVAAATMVIHYQVHSFPSSRVSALSRHGEVATLGANLYGMFAAIGLSQLIQPSTRSLLSRKRFWILFTATMMLSFFLVLAQTRGAIVALVMAIGLLLIISRHWKLLLFLAATATLLVVSVEQTDLIRGFFERGFGARPLIWAESWQQVMERPVFGHGRTASFVLEGERRNFGHPHNFILYLLLQSGFIGLFLWLASTIYVAYKAISVGKDVHDWTLLIMITFGIVAMMFTSRDFLASPNTTWLLYWLPIGLVIKTKR